METEAQSAKTGTLREILRGRWPVLVTYLFVLVIAEVFIAMGTPIAQTNPSLSGFYTSIGLSTHILLVFALLFHAVLLGERDRPLALLLPAMSLASLDRILSLAVPGNQVYFTTLQWLGLVSIPLLTAAGSVAYVLGMRLKDIGFGAMTWSGVVVQAGIGCTGIVLGIAEFFILRSAPSAYQPTTKWLVPATGAGFAFGVLVLFLATGLSEELIFRGIMLRRAVEALGSTPGLLFVTVVFAALHLFYNTPADLAFVFGVGLFYGIVVLKTKQLWGVTISHTIANVVLYLVAPFVFAVSSGT
jgi:uncharacterized protein